MNYLQKLFSLEGKTAIVTGSSRGNGKAIATALGRSGAKLIIIDVGEKVFAVRDEFISLGIDCTAYSCDFLVTDQLDSLLKEITDNHKIVDILVNNAGVTFGGDTLSYCDKLWDKTYKVNLLAPHKICKAIGSIMVENGKGSIINITSLNAEQAFPDNPAYVSFKGALKQLTKSLALDLGKHGVRCNNIGPGYIRTDMTKGSWADEEKRAARCNSTVLGRWGTPDDLSGVAIFLASDASDYVTGQDFYVDGGWLIKGL